ncbi:MAG: hypothetical protein KAQ69_01840 [Spirochaetales bacterium]|nr:hypothetical protein [Spirochaetales bacterium]
MNITPVNEAEAVIEPFWDDRQIGLSEWDVDPGHDHGLDIYQNWDSVAFSWDRYGESINCR